MKATYWYLPSKNSMRICLVQCSTHRSYSIPLWNICINLLLTQKEKKKKSICVNLLLATKKKKKRRSILSTFYIYRAYDRKHLLAKRKEIVHLKKCAPTMRSWELVFSPTMLRSIVDVFVAKMQWAGQAFSIPLNIFCFKGTLSMTACKRGKSEQYILSRSSIHKIFHYHKNTG